TAPTGTCPQRQPARHELASGLAADLVRRESPGDVGDVAADPPLAAVLHHFFDRAAGKREDGRAARQRFDHHQTKWFFPLNWEQQRTRAREQTVLCREIGLTEVLNLSPIDQRFDLAFPIVSKGRLDFAGELETDAGASRRVDG